MPGVLIKRGKFVYRNTDTRRGAHVKLKVEIGMMQLQAKCLSLFRWFLLADVLADPQGSQAPDTSVPHRCPISLTAASPHPDTSLHP